MVSKHSGVSLEVDALGELQVRFDVRLLLAQRFILAETKPPFDLGD
jgi:hypothetical protein